MTSRPGFRLARADIALPRGASAQTHRHVLTRDGRPVLGFTQGTLRPYLYPVYTSQGFLVTQEAPADHPHHSSVWVGLDHLHVRFTTDRPVPDEGTYGFFVNETFQGRAPGRIRQRDVSDTSTPAGHQVRQDLEWRGPGEWGAPDGRVLARERRETHVHARDGCHVVDVTSTLEPTDWQLVLGPTRHAYFGVRVAESMAATNGGHILCSDGHEGPGELDTDSSHWLRYSGSVGGSQMASVTLMPRIDGPVHWFVTDWGVVHVNPFADQARRLDPGESLTLGLRVLVHDLVPDAATIRELGRWESGPAPGGSP